MTVPLQTRRSPLHLGNGVADSFAFSFKVFSSADVAVTTADADGVETERTLNTDYTVSVNADQDATPGGTITYPITGTKLQTGEKLVIVGATAATQLTDLQSYGFYPQSVEDMADRLTMILQQLQDTAARTAVLADTTAEASLAFPSPESDKLIAWNTAGDALVNKAFMSITGGIVVSSFAETLLDDETTADARTTLGVPAAANGTHTGTTAVQTLNVSVAATVPTPTAAEHSARKDYVDARLPAGFVSAFAGGTAPTGWLECDGSSIAVASYPDLHAAIGYTYGGSGASFNLPDLRGEFIRGWVNSRSGHPDSGRTRGTYQADEYESHTHSLTQTAGGTVVTSGVGGGWTLNPFTGATNASGGAETRPRNVAMMYCIKA